MAAFLITFKPTSENPERGWPLPNLLKLVERLASGQVTEENWRFRSLRKSAVGDRVFLLLQGKRGPGIIGYGALASRPAKDGGIWRARVQFEKLVDPTTATLATREELEEIEGGQKIWRTQSSGIELPPTIATTLEKLVVGREAIEAGITTISNPDWTRDEQILALSLYLKHRPNPPGKQSEEVNELSKALRRLGGELFGAAQISATFRNANGVYMKLMNFRRFDPLYTSQGKTGLPSGANGEETVWLEFASDVERCHSVADAILASVDKKEHAASPSYEAELDDMEEAPEGRLLTRTHLARERNARIVKTKRQRTLKALGKLACEACGFDFVAAYGPHGHGFAECHHTKPVATLLPGHKTHVNDLAIVCANCHRMIHRRKPWLSLAELRTLISQAVGH